MSGITCLSILLCLLTIVSRCEEDKPSRSAQTSRPSTVATTTTKEQEQGEKEQEECDRDKLSASGAAREGQPASTPVAGAAEVSLGSSRQTQSQAFQILNPKPCKFFIVLKHQ